jgi:hypothetical protein
MRLTEYGRNPQKRKAYMQQSEGPICQGWNSSARFYFTKNLPVAPAQLASVELCFARIVGRDCQPCSQSTLEAVPTESIMPG